jgi:hypothetical protein
MRARVREDARGGVRGARRRADGAQQTWGYSFCDAEMSGKRDINTHLRVDFFEVLPRVHELGLRGYNLK